MQKSVTKKQMRVKCVRYPHKEDIFTILNEKTWFISCPPLEIGKFYEIKNNLKDQYQLFNGYYYEKYIFKTEKQINFEENLQEILYVE